MPLLSAVITTLNEEKNIGRCLNSLQDVADDIVVLDAFSSDQTEAICCSYPRVRFFQRDWEGYSAAKNYANQLAAHDYIFSLDADEALSDELKMQIASIKKNYQYEAYSFNRLNNYCGQWIYYCDWYPDKKIRLWNRQKARWEGAIHESLAFEKMPTKKHVTGDILHYSYNSIEQHISIACKYSELAARELVKKNKKIGFVKLWFSPFWRFITIFWLKQGFRDGFYGLIIAMTSAYAGFLKYALVKHYHKQKSQSYD